MKRIGVLSSGGDTPGMNAAIRAVVKVAAEYGIEVFGIRHGYRGLIEGDMRELTTDEVRNIAHKGGTILKTARCKEFMVEEGQRRALLTAQAFDLEGIIAIGGDGTMHGAGALSKMGIPTITLPGTIDNDLAYTDFSIGFDTAVNGVLTELIKVRDTMVSHDRIGIVEVMGNKCGDIALHAGVAGSADFILLPEMEFDIDEICDQLIKNNIRNRKTSMIVLAEGAGKGDKLAGYIREKTKLEVKSVVLGYTQRGGSPTGKDRILATRLGGQAVSLLAQGVSNRAVGIHDNKVQNMDIYEALDAEKQFDSELYTLGKLMAR